MENSLFGFLANRFSSHPENLATEALGYILGNSSAASAALVRHLKQLGLTLPKTLIFRTQVSGDDGAIPDLVGLDGNGNPAIIIEAKFWAGLTDHQPVTYLGRFAQSVDAALLFIVPSKRIPTLWPELIERCKSGKIVVGKEGESDGDIRTRRIGNCHLLGLTSWQSILALLLHAVEAEGNSVVAADLRQLQGLCSRMDQEAFLPVRSEELSPQIGRRLTQLCHLVDDVTDTLVAEGIASVKGLKATGGFAWYGRYLSIHKNGCCVYFDAEAWSTVRETPLWLSVKGPDYQLTASIQSALSGLERQDPPRMLRGESELLIPLMIPTGLERDAVLRSLLDQVREVATLLKTSQAKRSA